MELAAYWIIDPDGPRLLAYNADPATGTYVEAADLTDDTAFTADVPFPVTIDLAALVR